MLVSSPNTRWNELAVQRHAASQKHKASAATGCYIYHDHAEVSKRAVSISTSFVGRARVTDLRLSGRAEFRQHARRGLLAHRSDMIARQIAPDLLRGETQFLDFTCATRRSGRHAAHRIDGATLTAQVSPERIFGLRIPRRRNR